MACNMFLDFYNGHKMPIIGFGTWTSKDEVCEQAMEEALSAGYRHIDTAFGYENEKAVGRVINKWISLGKLKREDIFLTTKLHGHCLRPDRVEHYMKKSLDNLQLDYVDLYLIHFPTGLDHDKYLEGKWVMDHTTDLEGCWKKMEEQVDAKRTKSIGISNFNTSQIQRIINIAKIKPANLQIEIHLYLQNRKVVDFCKKNGITVVAYCPLGNPGFNKFLVSVGQQPRDYLPDILSNSTLIAIAEKHKKTPAQVALRHIVQRGIAPIPKSANSSRIQENINIFDFVLDRDDMAALDALEVGPSTRICNFIMIDGALEHPEFPFSEEYN